MQRRANVLMHARLPLAFVTDTLDLDGEVRVGGIPAGKEEFTNILHF
jgi:hypothetical protein